MSRQVVITHTNFALYWPARLHALSNALRERDWELSIVAVTDDPGPYSFAKDLSGRKFDGRFIHLFGQADISTLNPTTVSRRLWDTLEKLKPDAVISGAIAFTPGATAVRWCRSRRRGLTVMDDARREDVPRSPLVNLVKKRFYANVDAAFIPAASHADAYEAFGVKRDRIFFGVDVVDNDFYARRVAECRAQDVVRIGQSVLPPKFFLGVGRQVAKKNWLMALRAFAQYRKTAGPQPWDLVLIGEGPERASLEGFVKQQKVLGVHFLPFASPGELSIAYANAGCMVLPSFYGETWGLVVNEAMASGLPVLVSGECGCASTLVRAGYNGWIFSPHEDGELATQLSKISTLDSSILKQMGDASRRLIAEWSLDRFARGGADAVLACAEVRRSFSMAVDRWLLPLWKGRFRTT